MSLSRMKSIKLMVTPAMTSWLIQRRMQTEENQSWLAREGLIFGRNQTVTGIKITWLNWQSVSFPLWQRL
jgi:hypothetical protein